MVPSLLHGPNIVHPPQDPSPSQDLLYPDLTACHIAILDVGFGVFLICMDGRSGRLRK